MKFRILTVLLLTALTITPASAQYIRTDLVSNQPGVAPTTDPHLANGWGLVTLPGSPYWVATMAPDSPPSAMGPVSKFHSS